MNSDQYPKLGEMVKNFAELSKAIGKNPKMVTTEVYQERMKTCFDCPSFDSTQIRCRSCGCMMKAKARFQAARCPLKKWKT